ncbi:MAG: IS6 family transposase [Thermoplasmata archaeon]
MTAVWQDARTPALAIVARGDQIRTVTPAEYSVRSQSHPETTYKVTVLRERWSCECGFYAEGKQTCIHILAVRFREGFQSGPMVTLPSKPGCERCHSGDVALSGKRRNKSGTISRYLCKTCGFRFTGRDGFQHRRSDPEKIALALDLYFRGMSVRKVAEHLAQVHNLKVSPTTVYNWIAHFSRVAARWMDAQGATVGERWHVDETVVSVDGDRHYIWNVLDSETRFLLATHVSRDRRMVDTRAPLHKAKKVAETLPTEVFTDGMRAYPRAVHNEFGRGGYSPHHRVPSIRAAESNNLVERLHGTEKERIKVMRGFDTLEGTSALAEGFRVHYNMVRNHMALGATPGSVAGIPPIDGFRWSEILRMATQAPTGETVIRVVTERMDRAHQHD